MSKSAFTPGPWEVQKEDGWSNSIAIIATDEPLDLNRETRGMLAYVTTEVATGNARYAHANARLIAAAPEMFEALKELVAACNEDFMGEAITDDDGDDEAVGGGLDGDMALTFGMIRRARSALLKALPNTKTGVDAS